MNQEFISHIQYHLNSEITDISQISGGDISNAYKLKSNKQVWFLKCNAVEFVEAYEIEFDALHYLESKSSLLIPKANSFGRFRELSYLLLEYIEPVLPNKEFWIHFGSGLAELHRNRSSTFGWLSDNYIGPIKQKNSRLSSWSEFYHRERLYPLIQRGIKSGIFSKNNERMYQSVIRKLDTLIPYEDPSLCHGDLWNGNFISGHAGPYLIDPSGSYMHREMDIAMTKLFGGFDPIFYESYNHDFPLESGFDERIDIYQLYYLLVHALLFGGNYISSVQRILKKFGA